MSAYLLEAIYTNEAWGHLVNNPQNRQSIVEPMVKELGGTILHAWATAGKYDIVAVLDLPDDVSAAAYGMVTRAAGTLQSIRFTPLLTLDQGVKAARRAGQLEFVNPVDVSS